MFLELERVPPDGQPIDRVVARGDLPPDDEFRPASDVILTGRIALIESEEEGAYRLEGTLEARVEVPCVRCLEPVFMDLREKLDLIYLPQSRNVAPVEEEEEIEERGLDSEELAVSFYRDDRVDLGQMILEQIVLALPMKTLCKADCLGLCPECGSNRNRARCECVPEDSDPRWETLKTLLGR